MQEWLNWPLSKSGEPTRFRGFESLSLRQEGMIMTKSETVVPPKNEENKKSDTLGIMSMVFGVVSLTGPGLLLGIPAIIMGAIALKRSQSERGLSLTGIITGAISTLISLLFIGLVIFGLIWGINHPEYLENERPRPEYRLESSET